LYFSNGVSITTMSLFKAIGPVMGGKMLVVLL